MALGRLDPALRDAARAADAAMARRRALLGRDLAGDAPWQILLKLILDETTPPAMIAAMCDLPLSVAQRWLALLVADGWIVQDGNALRVTPRAKLAVGQALNG